MGTAEAIRATIGIPLVRMMQADYDRAVQQGRRMIGPRQFDLAWSAGRERSIEQAFETATTMSLITPAVGPAAPFGLTTREIEVLRLIAEGLSDQDIADELFIGYRTVTSHVANIRGKLNVTSRTAAGAQALRLGIITLTPVQPDT